LRDAHVGVLPVELASGGRRDVASDGRCQSCLRTVAGCAASYARNWRAELDPDRRGRAHDRARRHCLAPELQCHGVGLPADVATGRGGRSRPGVVGVAARQSHAVPVLQLLMELPRSPGPAIERAATRWLAARWTAAIGCLIAAAAFVVWVDPFQQYHLASRYPPRFYFLHHRYINPGLARNQAYDTVVSGSSIMENTPNDLVAQACGGSSVNLSMPAMSASEQRLMLETALASQPVKRVIAVLDFNEFAGGIEERQDVAGPLPRYLYDRNPFNDLPYLLSWDVLAKAWHIVNGDTGEKFTSDPNGAWFWGNVVRFGREQVLRGL